MAIAAACPRAMTLGLQPGMALAQARALLPELDARPAEPDADSAVLTHLALFAARRWTPCAALCEPSGLWLDLSGVSHLFGGEQRMCERILLFCSRLGFAARMGVAGTSGAAHALARFGKHKISLCPNGRETEAIAPFPPEALRIDEILIRTARRFGIDTVAELMAIPRGPLARRFGANLLNRLDQALGRAEEPFEPIIPEEPPKALLRFLEPILSAEAISQVLTDLVRLLVRRLERQALGARQVYLICSRVDGHEQRLVIGTASATRDPAHLHHLLHLKIEAIEPGFGIEAMQLVASRCEPLGPRQIGSNEHEVDLPPLIDRIASRIGSSHVFRLSAVDSDVPERALARIPPLDEAREWPSDWPRPVRLLERPEPVDHVIAELPDQPPVRFSWRGTTHRVRNADGPERIHGEWWKRISEADAVRDYFQVEDESGARFWLFRRGDGVNGRTGDLRWYVHGVFA
jgi:protein ImuB